MKTILVNVPDKDESVFMDFLKKFKIKSRIVMEEEKAMAKWIDEGMESEDIEEEKVFTTLRKHGVEV